MLSGLLALAAVGLATSPALACGGLVSPNGSADMSGFAAMISYDGTTEDALVGVLYQNSPATDFGWLLPLPSQPAITDGDPSGIVRAEEITRPPEPPDMGIGGGGARAPGSTSGVTELGRTTVHGLEFVTLAAGDTAALAQWMNTHGFTFHDRQAATIQTYLDRHWVVVVARATPDKAPASGVIWVRMQFTSADLTYPMAIAGASHPGSLKTTLFIITPYRPQSKGLTQEVQRPADDGTFEQAGSRLELRYSAPLTSADAALLSPSVPIPNGAWLTRYDSTWTEASLTSDLVLVRSTDQSTVDYSALEQKYAQQRLTPLLIIGGIAIALILLLVVGVVAVILVVVRSRQRGRPAR